MDDEVDGAGENEGRLPLEAKPILEDIALDGEYYATIEANSDI